MKSIISLLSSMLMFLSAFAQNEDVLIGTKKTIRTKVYRTDVSWSRINEIEHIYTPPPGWQILSFKPVIVSQTPKVTYKFSTTPSNFENRSNSIIYAKFIELYELAAEKNVSKKYDSVIDQMR